MNLPLTGLAVFLVSVFLHVRSPEGSIREKLARMDWLFVSAFLSIHVSVDLTEFTVETRSWSQDRR